MESININLDGFADPEEVEEMGRALLILHAYAECKAIAMRSRIAGNIEGALFWENRCQFNYEQLPDWAKW